MSEASNTPITGVGALPGVPVKPNRVTIRPEWFPNAPDPNAYALVLKGTCLGSQRFAMARWRFARRQP
jgi:hypothetical protein